MNPDLDIPISEDYQKIFDSSDWFFVPISVLVSLVILKIFQRKLIKDLPQIVCHYYLGFILRVAICFFAMFLFQYHFKSGDIFHYRKSAKVLSNLAVDNPIHYFEILTHFKRIKDPDVIEKLELPIAKTFIESVPTGIIVRIASVFMILLGNSTLAVGVIFCLFSYVGIWMLYRYLSIKNVHLEKHFRFVILYFPSILFWSSNGIGKEAIAFGALSILMIMILKKFDGKIIRPFEQLILLFSIILIFFIKIYIWLSVLVGLVAWKVAKIINTENKHSNIKKAFKSILILFLGLVVIALNYAINVKLKNANDKGMIKVINSISTYNKELTGGSSYRIEKLSDDIVHDIKIVSLSLFTALYRPFIWESKNNLTLFYAIESLFLLIFTLFLIIKTSKRQLFKLPEIIFLLFFSLSVMTIAGYSAQNFGTLARYRSLPLTFFLIAGILTLYPFKQKK